jgi:hypothetical protein
VDFITIPAYYSTPNEISSRCPQIKNIAEGKHAILTNCLLNTTCFSVHKFISNSKCLQMVLGDVVRMVWPPQSPDLNPIEAMWDYIDSKLNRSLRTSEEKMWQMVQDVWKSIPRKILKK